jgi:outer membrane receptor for ferrienterochelin and colicins
MPELKPIELLPKQNNLLIARTNDPLIKMYDTNGQVLATPENPYGLTFDTTYVYGPNQGIRSFSDFVIP